MRSAYSSLPDRPPQHPLAIAHRHGNLVELLELATAAGVDLLEMDVYLRRGRLEVRHARSIGPWLLEGIRLTRRPQDQLTLETLLGSLPEGAALMVDLKGWRRETGPRVAEAMRTLHPGRPYAVCGRRWALLEGFTKEPTARVVWSAGSRAELRRLLARLAARPAWGVSVRRQLLTPDLVDQLRRLSRVVMAWHVEDAERLHEVLGLGVNAVICDDLEVLGRLISERDSGQVAPP